MSSIARRYLVLLFLAFSAVLCLARSGEWWEEKPIAQWSNEQIYEFLNSSPWVGSNQGYFQQGPWVSGSDVKTRRAPVVVLVHYQARILTARPVREALLQLNVLNPKVVTAKSIQATTTTEELQNRMRELLATHPNDLLVKGNEKHLIIAVSQKVRMLGTSGIANEQEVFLSDELLDVDQSKLTAITSLATNNGKKVELADYRPPDRSQAGATYYFPRNLPDGTPLVSSSDKELIFETVINQRRVKIKFDLGKLKYKGKLEI
jgi:hypothetical protein